MKYGIFFQILIVCLLGGVSACDFLEESPETSPVEKDIYSTEAGAESVLTGCYQALAQYYSVRGYELSTNSIWISSHVPLGVYYAARIGDKHPGDSEIQIVFTNVYTFLSRVNDLLANIDAAPISVTVREQIKGEALFLRAFGYFELVRFFGRVPLVTEPILTPSQINVPRATLRQIYGQILDDLTAAESLMPRKMTQTRVGHPHALAATALKAKVYLWMASLTDDHFDVVKEPADSRYTAEEQRSFYQSAYDKAHAVEDSGQYRLMANYGDLWNNKTKNCEESIFEIQFSANYGVRSQIPARTACGSSVFRPNYKENTLKGRIRISKMLFAEHWSRHGNANSLTQITSNCEQNIDPRININYLYCNDYRPDMGEGGTLPIYPKMQAMANVDQYLPYIKKYWYDEFNGNGDNNFVAFRYAEVLLILAEAANELDKTSEAVDYVNKILDRAADVNGNGVRDADEIKPIAWDRAAMTQEEVRSELPFERVFELAGEGVEHYEFRRYGIDHMRRLIELHDYWLEIMKKPIAEGGWGKTSDYNKSEKIYGNVTDDFLRQSLYFPYPRTQIQLNDAISEEDQNLGWEYK